MILKMRTQREGKEANVLYDEWNYFDNIESASNYYDEGSGNSVVRCGFRDGSVVTFSILDVAYLMSDAGKTIEKLYAAVRDSDTEAEDAYSTLQDAVSAAKMLD